MRAFLLLIYRILIAPLGVLLALTLGALFIPKVREGLKLRRIKRDWPVFSEPPVWIHASSGEFEYAKPFITELKARRPTTPVVVTYFTPSFAAAIARFPGVDFSLPLPFDLPGPTRAFLLRLKPQAGFIARTDLWPELLHQANAIGIPMVLFSVTKTRPPSLISGVYQNWLMRYMTSVYCVGEEDAKILQHAVAGVPISAIGDTRFDQVLQRLKNPRRLKEELKPDRAKTILAGSTWSEDEAVLIQGLQELLLAKRLQLVLVPHEPTPAHIQGLQEMLQKRGIPVTRYSTATQFSDGVLLVDQTGILAELYTWGAIAFVGGSFRKSVHSVMEPIAAGCWTWVGPHHRNNREAIDFQALSFAGIPFVQAVGSASEITAAAQRGLTDLPPAFMSAAQNEIHKRGGASRRLVDFTQPPPG